MELKLLIKEEKVLKVKKEFTFKCKKKRNNWNLPLVLDCM